MHEQRGAPELTGRYQYATVLACERDMPETAHLPLDTTTTLPNGQLSNKLLHCSHPSAELGRKHKYNSRKSSTVALLLPHAGGPHADELSVSPEGPNLYHLHASAFRFWISLNLPSAVISSLTTNFSPNINTNTSTNNRLINKNAKLRPLHRVTHAVLLLPRDPCIAARLPTEPFAPTPSKLAALSRGGSSRSALESLQALSDALGGSSRVLATCQGIVSPSTVATAVETHGFPRIRAVVVPPPGGFMWDIPGDAGLSKRLRCSRSLLSQYSSSFLPKRSRKQVDKRKIARHVCFMSRQTRQRPGGKERGKLRNLDARFMASFVTALRAPLLLSPVLGLRESEDEATLKQASMDGVSVAGQLRFVNAECAVLVGVHGAGLTNALGLRRGTAVIELMPKGKNVHYFRNVAALMSDVEYDVVQVHTQRSELSNGAGEVDLMLDEDETDAVIRLVKTRLRQSLQKQGAV